MLRDVNTVPGGDPVSGLPLAPATRLAPSPTQPPANRRPSLELVDPFSQQMIVHTKPGTATVTPDLSPVPRRDAPGGAPKALRLLQVALLSSVAVMVCYMVRLLLTTQ